MNRVGHNEGFVDCKCPYCGVQASFLETFLGTVQRCPKCLESIIVPEDDNQLAATLPLPLTTPRLTLRRLKPSDWKDLLEIMSDAELLRHAGLEVGEEADIVHWLEVDARLRLPEDKLCLGLEVSGVSKVIGWVTVGYQDDTLRQGGISILINSHYQHQGYGTEALRAILALGFDTLHLHRIAFTCESRANHCHHLLEKIGMRREAEFVQDRLVKGQWANTVWYGMLAEEYRSISRTG
jgi:RimJ/RimL family protein N-acetyltransferase